MEATKVPLEVSVMVVTVVILETVVTVVILVTVVTVIKVVMLETVVTDTICLTWWRLQRFLLRCLLTSLW